MLEKEAEFLSKHPKLLKEKSNKVIETKKPDYLTNMSIFIQSEQNRLEEKHVRPIENKIRLGAKPKS